MKTTSVIISILCISSNIFAVLNGSGTERDPYLIQSRADFDEFSNPANAATYWARDIHAKLMCDLDLAGTTYTQAVIGPSDSLRYSGIFDGNGKVISNLTIYKTSSTLYGGLFGFLWFGQIKNLGLENAWVHCSSSTYVGGLVGRVLDSRVLSCYTTGSVRGNQRVGGLAGQSGGRSGLINCYSTASVSGSYIVGGLVGWVSGSPRFCYSTGTVVGSTYVGGFMGYGYQGTIRAQSCFWDIQTSGISRGTGYGSSEQIFGKTTAEMKTLETFTNAGWDFSATDGNPALWWMPTNDYPKVFWELPWSSIMIVVPIGGEYYTLGNSETISWESEGGIFNVTLDYSTDYGSTWNYIDTVANTGSFIWTIPDTPSTNCLIRISNADDPDTFDISDDVFTIHPAYPMILTINISPKNTEINTVKPFIGTESYQIDELVTIEASRFVKCPNVFHFDHWLGDVIDPASSTTQVLMDADKEITAVFVDGRKCGDECHPNNMKGDLNHDCIIDIQDFAILASRWLDCTKPECY